MIGVPDGQPNDSPYQTILSLLASVKKEMVQEWNVFIFFCDKELRASAVPGLHPIFRRDTIERTLGVL